MENIEEINKMSLKETKKVGSLADISVDTLCKLLPKECLDKLAETYIESRCIYKYGNRWFKTREAAEKVRAESYKPNRDQNVVLRIVLDWEKKDTMYFYCENSPCFIFHSMESIMESLEDFIDLKDEKEAKEFYKHIVDENDEYKKPDE